MDGTRLGKRTPMVPRELVLVSGLILAVVCWLFLVAFAGLNALSSVRAYIAGEGFYSKAQKDAVEHLLRYAETRNELEYERYQTAIAVPIADGRARQELERRDGRTEVALRSLEAGGNHPDDVESMTLLFRHAGWLREMADAIVIWSSADAEIANLDAAARALHAELTSTAPRPQEVSALLTQVGEVNDRLTNLEESFSHTLGAGARRVRRIVLAAMGAASAVLLALAVLSSARLLRRIRRSDERFRSMIEHAHDIVAIIRPDARLEYTSPAILRVLGYQVDELVGRSALAFIHSDDQAIVVRALGRIVEDPGSTQRAEFRFRHKDGTWRTLAATGGAAPGDSAQPPIIVNAGDISDRKRLEEQLLQAQKMESIGRLAGGIAHDFNNLLTAILGSARLARAELAAQLEVRAEIEQIESAAQRAASLTRQLLAFSSHDRCSSRVSSTWTAWCRRWSRMLRRLIGEDIRDRHLAAARLGRPRRSRPDRAGARQSRGQRAGRDARRWQAQDRRRADVRISREEASRLTGRSVEDWVRLEVEDSGPRHDVERCGARVRALLHHEGAKGTGLGLATVYGIVTQSGGHIALEMPRAAARSSDPPALHRAGGSGPGSGRPGRGSGGSRDGSARGGRAVCPTRRLADSPRAGVPRP